MPSNSPEIIEIRELDTEIIPPLTSRFEDPNYNGGTKLVVIGKPGCFAKGTKVLMYDGKIKNIEDIKVGEKVMGDDSKPRNVLELCRNKDIMYKIIPKKGSDYIVNKNHILSLKCTDYNSHKKDEILDITVKDFLKKSKTFQLRYKWYRTGVEFTEQEIKLNPYLLGYWLGDKYSRTSSSTTDDKEIVDLFNEKLTELNLYLKQSSKYTYRIKQNGKPKFEGNEILKGLKYYNLLNNKHIPYNFKVNSRKNRLEIFRIKQ